MKKSNIFRSIIIFFLIGVWVFSGWPPIFQNLSIAPHIQKAYASWWNSSWQYEKPITITNTNTTLSNFPVKIIIDTQSLISTSKMQSSCADIRFVDSDNATQITNYWIHQGCNTASTEIWVKVPSIPNGTKTIYMYYGNASAPAVSSGTNTFIFYSDGSSLSGWTNSGSATSSIGIPAPSFIATGGKYAYRNISLATSTIFEFDGYVISGTTDLANVFFLNNASGAGQMFRLEARSGFKSGFASTASWTSWSGSSACSAVTAGVWHSIKIALGSTTATGYIDGTPCGSAYTFSNKGGYISISGDGGVVTGGHFDNIRTRPYAASDPTTSVGIEGAYISEPTQIDYRWRNDDGSETSATWPIAQNTALTNLQQNTTKRLRFEITNTGNQAITAAYRLEYATSTGGPWTAVPSLATSQAWQMSTSAYITDGSSTTNQLTAENTTFVPGEIKDTGNQTGNITLTSTNFTEIEYAIEATSNAIAGNTYFFRLSNAGTPLTNYSIYPSATIYMQANWYSQSWLYRKSIPLTGSGTCGTNDQIKITVGESSGTTGTNVNVDSHSLSSTIFDDVLFTKNDGTTLISYWEQSVTGTSPNRIATFWVKIPDDLSNGNASNIFIYYGNTSATSLSNATNTFIFFDTGSATSNWTVAGTSGQDTSLGNPAPSYKVAGSNGSYMYQNIGLTTNETLEYDAYSGVLGNLFFLTNSSGVGQMLRIETRSGNSSGIASTNSWTLWNAPTSCSYVSANAWHSFELDIGGTTAQSYIDGSSCDSGYTFSNNGGYIGLIGDAGGGQTNWDNLRVRKYCSPIPSIGTPGSEELVTNTVSCTLNNSLITFGTLSPSVISTASPNVTITASTTDPLGITVSVNDSHAGLLLASPTHVISSSSTTLTTGTEGYGIQATSTSGITVTTPYNKTGYAVGGLATSTQTLASASTTITNSTITIDHLASISNLTPSGSYADTVTYSCIGN